MGFRALSIVFIFLGLLSACATAPVEVLSEKEYYQRAKRAIDAGNFVEASAYLEDLETYHPFGRYAEQAQLDLIYARYNSLQPELAASAADRFIRLHPDSDQVDYAYYLRGLTNFYADVGLGQRYLPVDPNSRDPGKAREAFRDFSTLVERFPASDYAADARQRMIAIKERLAQHELFVARYYVRRQAFIAAAARTAYVIQNLPQTQAVEEALTLQVEILRKLGLDTQAADTLAVLAASYPNSSAFDSRMRFKGGQLVEEDRDIFSVLKVD
ncbi:MAG: outer membrane protein assembly factor BamD [unclassified Hahellaceae]|nr:outer membrane protein assembly factor BamD [Hahellaceae bacterium]|tara:strand:+ start:10087 stop:10899 length:813 start_codon:yes stop_codon:yes gene_type:complete